ncbi:MAG: hypothetical protein QOI50_6940 [Pseudonocardiales bacterium]|nr:hypothetical protein [Pseudonocardiales bacterium]
MCAIASKSADSGPPGSDICHARRMATSFEVDPEAALAGATRLALLADELASSAARVHGTVIDPFLTGPGAPERRDLVADRLGRYTAELAELAADVRRGADAARAHESRIVAGTRQLESRLSTRPPGHR